MALDPLHRERQLKAIEIGLATAPKIQDDLKAKFGYGKNKFFDLDLMEYRINNSGLDIAEDLDVKSLYSIKENEVARKSVNYAFRGHNNEDFKPEYQFNGLFSEEMNDMIKGIRSEMNGQESYEQGIGIHALTPEERFENGWKGGQIAYEQGIGIHALTPEERSELGRKGGQIAYEQGIGIHALTPEERSELGRKSYELGIGVHGRTPEERSEHGRKGGLIGGPIGGRARALAQGQYVWSLEEIVDIYELKYGEGLTWKDTTSEMNEKYDKNWTRSQISGAYHSNKHLLSDEEE